MVSFIQYFVLYSALMLVIAIPVFLVARKRRRVSTIRKFAIGAVSVGASLAVIRVASELSIQQCLDAGNTQCLDAGSTGLAVLFIGGFTLVAWMRAWVLRS